MAIADIQGMQKSVVQPDGPFERYVYNNRAAFERLAESDLPISIFCQKCLEAVD